VDDEIVTLATFSDPLEAEHVKAQLEAEDIRVFQSGEETSNLFTGLGGAFAQVQLHVAEKDLKRAMCVLSRLDEDEDEDEEEEARPAEESSEAITGAAPPRPEEAASDAIQVGRREGLAEVKPPVWEAAEEAAAGEDEDETGTRWTAEDFAERAWRAAFFGMVTLPVILHIYSAVLVLLMTEAPGELSASGTRKVFVAVVIDLLVLGAAGLFMPAMFGR
jgi:hypothetical protein